jgi:hypothetical protein
MTRGWPEVMFFDHVYFKASSRPNESLGDRLNAPRYSEDQENDQDQAEPATGIIAPARAVRPCRQSCQKYEHKYDEEYGSCQLISPFLSVGLAVWCLPGCNLECGAS